MTHPPSPTAGRLTGNLGTTSIVLMVVAAAAPLTVLGGNVPLMIGFGNGTGAPIGFVVATTVLLLFAIGFVNMTPFVREAGAFYAYVAKGLGFAPGIGTGFLALLSYTCMQVGMYGYMGAVLSNVVADVTSVQIPWWVYALATLAVIAFLGYRHIELSSKVLGIALIAEVGIVVVLDLAIVLTGGESGLNLQSFAPSNALSGPIGVAVLFALTGFIGFESTAVFRNEARDPDRTLPRATYIAVLGIGSFYLVSAWLMVLGYGMDSVVDKAQNDTDNFLFSIVDTYLGTVGRDIVQVLIITSIFACLLALHNVVARYQFALSRYTFMPSALGRVHDVHRSPHISSLTQSATALVLTVIAALLGLQPLTQVFATLGGIATIGMVALMTVTSIAAFRFFRATPSCTKPWQHRIAPALAVLGLLGSLVLVLVNFQLVTGFGLTVAVILATIPFLVFAVGTAVGAKEHRSAAELDADLSTESAQ
ncbi:APC family permease [Mycolicibacterium confluentis]|uniref:Amino acid transporter n=1 Tax=Mycolicibacterium confluentis TaxID=28047 RepID=A0A7I7XX38_9MYCO|nr:APC family permease [Mycolicibacterium confluentis]MCV7318533.1 APC family permease [Mycolicibacterium confluentis]ORV23812.1 amino acid transporter [Mycolicibacterium confluentis]BBZ33925.1 amino acid transporter [Mycolicibacterium confluentis]